MGRKHLLELETIKESATINKYFNSFEKRK